MAFRDLLGKDFLYFDGAMGTMLQAAGLQAGELPEIWNIQHPEKVQAVHGAYLAAGAQIIKTNTFGANSLKLTDTGVSVAEVFQGAVKNIRSAIVQEKSQGTIPCDREIFVALDMGPTGKLLQPFGDLPFAQAMEIYKEEVQAGVKAGADIILIETMSDSYEAKAAILAAKENSQLPIVCTFTFDLSGKLLNGADVETAFSLAAALGVDAVGFNCGLGPEQIVKLLPRGVDSVDLPIVVNPNAGLPVVKEGKTVFAVGPEEYGKLMSEVAAEGAALLGGCCGTTPEHIKALCENLKGHKPIGKTTKAETQISGYGSSVDFVHMPVIIGERINPTGKPRLKEALKAENMDYVCNLALEQLEKGASALDVNVGVPGVNEPALLTKAVLALQAITSVPLQIDTSDYIAMEQALRIYNGRPLLNSVNGKEEVLEKVLPLAKKYGAALVGLCLDDKGIPESAEERLAIAWKIIHRAKVFGIKEQDIFIDPLAMTISTGGQNAVVALDVVKSLHAKGIKTIMGVSNISFGLPARDQVNSTFLAMAMEQGLSAAILNPKSEAMLNAYYAYGALSNKDLGCKAYLEHFAGVKQEIKPQGPEGEYSLYEAIVKGLTGHSHKAVEKLLSGGKKPLDIINEDMIPALNMVGEAFEKKTLFLPQLLMSADAAKAGFDVIKQKFGPGKENGDPIVLATVKGDVHDIGKNIVKVLWENYGYKVIDLGKDVPPEKIVAATLENKAKLVGLSALMTTTVTSMEETIKQLRKAVDCKIVVGGAVLTEDYAKVIGADAYAASAVASVNYANKLFKK